MKTLLRRLFYTTGGLILLLTLFHLEENWRGRRAFAAWEQAQAAAGQRFDLAEFIPPPVPDVDNFALVPCIADAMEGRRPLLAPGGIGWPIGLVMDWRTGKRLDLEAFNKTIGGDLHSILDASRPQLDAFVQATRKPGCRIPMGYSRFPDIQIPALLGFRDTARMLSLRALVELREGRSDAAFEDVSAIYRTVHLFEKEPVLLTQLLRLALTGIALQPTWEGMQSHAWSRDQLVALQHQLTQIDLMGAFARTLRFEQGMNEADHLQVARERPWQWTFYPMSYSDAGKPGRMSSLFRHLLIPRGWVLQDGVRFSEGIQRVLLDPLQVADHQINPRSQDSALLALAGQMHPGYGIDPLQSLRALAHQSLRMANAQTGLDEAVVACQLERYRLERGAYPERLSDMGTPLPGDVIGGQPLPYRRTAEGGYRLYSVGWNAKDDGGEPGQGEDPWTQGDWVWQVAGQK